jgi:hypothetical protein
MNAWVVWFGFMWAELRGNIRRWYVIRIRKRCPVCDAKLEVIMTPDVRLAWGCVQLHTILPVSERLAREIARSAPVDERTQHQSAAERQRKVIPPILKR